MTKLMQEKHMVAQSWEGQIFNETSISPAQRAQQL